MVRQSALAYTAIAARQGIGHLDVELRAEVTQQGSRQGPKCVQRPPAHAHERASANGEINVGSAPARAELAARRHVIALSSKWWRRAAIGNGFAPRDWEPQ